MPDWRDVMEARREASEQRAAALSFARTIAAHGNEHDGAAVLALVGEAVCAELRALATAIAHEVGDAAREHAGRG